MATRKIFIPKIRGQKYIKEYEVEFVWKHGPSIQQTRECIDRMHLEAKSRYKLENLSEISGASPTPLCRLLSAFQLPIRINGVLTTVESAYQGSKVFEKGGPYQDLYDADPRDAKKDPRIKNSGKITSFRLGGIDYNSEPKTAFYDILYIGALQKFIDDTIGESRFIKHFGQSGGFTDIYFNPRRGVNCQARSVALFISLKKRGLIDYQADFQSYNIFEGGL